MKTHRRLFTVLRTGNYRDYRNCFKIDEYAAFLPLGLLKYHRIIVLLHVILIRLNLVNAPLKNACARVTYMRAYCAPVEDGFTMNYLSLYVNVYICVNVSF